MVAKFCPKLTTLKISLYHPWGVTDKAYFWSGLAPLSLTTLQIMNVQIILPKRNNSLQGEIDCLSTNCPMLECLYLGGVGTSPLEVRDLDKFRGFKNLKTVYFGEAFTWTSFQALLSFSPNLEKIQVDKINEHVVGKPPNVLITDIRVG